MMNSQVLVSTMKQENHSLIKDMNLRTNAVVINQDDRDSEKYIQSNNCDILWVNSSDRGISRSRNLAIAKANSDICILADDDLIYVDNYHNIITDSYKKYPNADILVFKVDGINKTFKNYGTKIKNISCVSSLKISSVQITFRRKSIVNKNIEFNEYFGSGSKYSMGEENIFLHDCLKNKLKIKYIPEKIADLYIGESSWFVGFNKKYLIDRGAGYSAMGKYFSIFLIIQFAIRKRRLLKENFCLFESIKTMLKGREEYIKLMEEKLWK